MKRDPDETLPIEQRKRRDELVAYCVKHLRFTVPQIHQFSRLWDHPFHGQTDVWRRIDAMKLRNRTKRDAEQSFHDLSTVKICLKLWGDARRNGIPVGSIEKEHRIGEESGIRADMKFTLGGRLFFLETQQSVLTFRGWKAKLNKYVRYRKRRHVRPFRVLIVMENESNLNTVYRYTKEVTREHPNLCVFYLAWQPDLLGHYNTVQEDIWVTNRTPDRKVEMAALV